MDNIFRNPNDKMEVEPLELTQIFTAVLTSALSKNLASHYERPWTDKQESDMQEKISALVAAATECGLKVIRVYVTRPNGQKVSRELSIDRISQTRSLQ